MGTVSEPYYVVNTVEWMVSWTDKGPFSCNLIVKVIVVVEVEVVWCSL